MASPRVRESATRDSAASQVGTAGDVYADIADPSTVASWKQRVEMDDGSLFTANYCSKRDLNVNGLQETVHI